MGKRERSLRINSRPNTGSSAGGSLIINEGGGSHTHTEYVEVSNSNTITAQHTFNFNGPPFVLGTNAQGEKVIGLNADELDGNDSSFYAAATDITALKAPEYLVLTANSDLTNERVWTDGNGIDSTDNGSGNTFVVKVDVTELEGDGLNVSGDTLVLAVPDDITTTSLNTVVADGHTHTLDGTTTGEADKVLFTNATSGTQLGNLGIGIAPSTSYPLRIRSTTDPQFRIEYDTNFNTDFYVDGVSGNLLITPVGDVNVEPQVSFNPNTSLIYDLGKASLQWRTLHALELRVGTLVAADELTTSGGRWLIIESSPLIADVNNSQTTIDIKNNFYQDGDIIYFDSGGSFEAMEIDSAPSSITNGYRYTVIRNKDGSGANSWSGGDISAGTGQSGDAHIEVYAEQSATDSGNTSGPTMVGWLRTATGTWPGLEPRWAVGNLDGLYSITGDVFGLGAGDPNEAYFTINDSSGLSIFENNKKKFVVNTSGELRIGSDTDTPSETALVIVSSASTYNSESFSVGDILIGDNSSGQANIKREGSEILFRTGTTERVRVSTLGLDAKAGASDVDMVRLDTLGVHRFIPAGAGGATVGEVKFLETATTATTEVKATSAFNASSTVETGILNLFGAAKSGDSASGIIEIAAGTFTDNSLSTSVKTALITLNGDDTDSNILMGGSGGSFNGVSISKVGTNNPTQILEIFPDANGEGIKSGPAFMGRGSLGGGRAIFCHDDYKLNGIVNGFVHDSTGWVFISSDSTATNNGQLRVNNISRMEWSNNEIIARTDNTTRSGFNANNIAFMGVGANGTLYANFSHYAQANGATSFALLQQSDGTTYLNAAATRTLFLRQGNVTRIQIGSTITLSADVTATSDINAEADLILDGDLKVNRTGTGGDIDGYVFVPLATETQVYLAKHFDSGDNGNSTISAATLGVPTSAVAVSVALQATIEIDGSGNTWPGGKRAFIYLGPSTNETDLGAEPQVEGNAAMTYGIMPNSGQVRCNASGGINQLISVPADVDNAPIGPGPEDFEYDMYVNMQVYGYWV